MSNELELKALLAKIANEIETNEATNDDAKEYKFYLENGGSLEELLKEKLNEYEPEGFEKANPNVKIVSYDSGGEGSAEDAPEFVFRYKPTGQLVGTNGWYASHYGTEWENPFKEYREVPTVVYRPK